ncbi:hypothetical protein ONS95_009624 [Cadophora gregata]|uniref:uncharacterized protein n=1 Tax=Cadophora gregata TaxID=51156 RepID=UPI0026DD5202|nr:uncharacterized protein ONS95_009624 [Cadophora gregata]KAK0124679.1 hypothetical protein ONS95_009624 [Cadophora gregata]KAK0129461.1 hypothetical protein ONS96_000033 [Cadophora gregata f. sp. sojae]
MRNHLLTTIITLSLLFTLAHSHGGVTSPQARTVGPAMKAACGEQVFNNLNSNALGPIEQLQQIGTSQKDFDATACELSLCKGLKFEDNSNNVQQFTAGQVVPFKVEIQAKHTGKANVSVVGTASNEVLGDMLVRFDVYASTATEVPKNQTEFDVTMPDVGAQCGEAGKCVVQWWWDSEEAKQTYMSCVDFVM